MKAWRLWTSLLLMGCVSGITEEMNTVVFREGIHLFVEGKSKDSFTSVPSVLVLLPSPLDKASGKVTLVCLVQGLPGGPTRIVWKANGRALDLEDTFTEIFRDSDGTYAATGLLLLPVSDWSPKTTYSCTVTQGSAFYEGRLQASTCHNLN